MRFDQQSKRDRYSSVDITAPTSDLSALPFYMQYSAQRNQAHHVTEKSMRMNNFTNGHQSLGSIIREPKKTTSELSKFRQRQWLKNRLKQLQHYFPHELDNINIYNQKIKKKSRDDKGVANIGFYALLSKTGLLFKNNNNGLPF